ncbi:MAG: hypothetical protein IJU71_05980 [Selenomonadaceae bacterium]|nr:hypothetical protein [Selenomonadaceae bacterium]
MEETTQEVVAEGIFSPAVADTILIALMVMFVMMFVAVAYLLSRRTLDSQTVNYLAEEVKRLSKKVRNMELEAKVTAGPPKVDTVPDAEPFGRSVNKDQEAQP